MYTVKKVLGKDLKEGDEALNINVNLLTSRDAANIAMIKKYHPDSIYLVKVSNTIDREELIDKILKLRFRQADGLMLPTVEDANKILDALAGYIGSSLPSVKPTEEVIKGLKLAKNRMEHLITMIYEGERFIKYVTEIDSLIKISDDEI